MKVCPTCKMTVDADSECPICHTTLTYEPTVDATSERYIFNKYLALHLLARGWLLILILLLALYVLIAIRPGFTPISGAAIALTVISIFVTLFPKLHSKALYFRYRDDYAERIAITEKYAFSILALVLWIFTMLIR